LVEHGTNEGDAGDVSDVAKGVLPNLELSIFKFTSIGHEMGNANNDIRGTPNFQSYVQFLI